MIHKRKRQAKPRHRRRISKAGVATSGREVEDLARGLNASIDGGPPTENIRKHPDEVYGDTEIPNRGKVLDQLKKAAR